MDRIKKQIDEAAGWLWLLGLWIYNLWVSTNCLWSRLLLRNCNFLNIDHQNTVILRLVGACSNCLGHGHVSCLSNVPQSVVPRLSIRVLYYVDISRQICFHRYDVETPSQEHDSLLAVPSCTWTHIDIDACKDMNGSWTRSRDRNASTMLVYPKEKHHTRTHSPLICSWFSKSQHAKILS